MQCYAVAGICKSPIAKPHQTPHIRLTILRATSNSPEVANSISSKTQDFMWDPTEPAPVLVDHPGDVILIPFNTEAKTRWTWPHLKAKVKQVTINKQLKAIMDQDPDTYNWVWSSINVAMGINDHTVTVQPPGHLVDMFPEAAAIYIVKKDDGIIGVMI